MRITGSPASPVISNNQILRCRSTGSVDGGGGIDIEGTSPTIDGNIISDNEAPNGAGIFVSNGQLLGGSNTAGADLGDVDGDGDIDAVAANLNQPNLVWINDGTGQFSDSGQSLANNLSQGVSLGDVDLADRPP